MNPHQHEKFEAMIAAWFDTDGLSAAERDEITAHMATCEPCRASFELAARMEAALVSRRDDVPAVDRFLPVFAPAHEHGTSPAHPALLSAFRVLMSPAGVSITLVIWASLLALRFRGQIGAVFAWTSADRFMAFSQNLSNLLMSISRGDPYLLTAIYIAIALVVLGSTGAITMRYIRHS